MPEKLFEIARRTFDTPEFRGIEFIEAECKTIINHVPGNFLPFNWTINPYRGCSHSCVYCFARPTHTFLDMNAGRDFESKIVVKLNAPEVLRRELAAKRWKGEHIAMGTNTDPYQRVEGRYKLMRGIIEVGIPTGVLMAPVLPGLSDRPEQLRAVVESCLDAGATHVSPIMLHLRPGVREEFLPWLEEHHPDLVPRYLEMYRHPYGPKADRDALGRTVGTMIREVGGTPREAMSQQRYRHRGVDGTNGRLKQAEQL